jgi:hypothetical protein
MAWLCGHWLLLADLSRMRRAASVSITTSIRRMTPIARTWWLVVAAFALHGPARAEVVEIDWGPQQRFEYRAPIAPGRFAELCGKLPVGASVAWQFEAAEPLDFNIHYHEGKAVHYPEKRNAAARGEGRLHAKIAQDYCWMWSNKSPRPAALKVRLAR